MPPGHSLHPDHLSPGPDDPVAAHPVSISSSLPYILRSAATIISFHCKYVHIMIPLKTESSHLDYFM